MLSLVYNTLGTHTPALFEFGLGSLLNGVEVPELERGSDLAGAVRSWACDMMLWRKARRSGSTIEDRYSDKQSIQRRVRTTESLDLVTRIPITRTCPATQSTE